MSKRVAIVAGGRTPFVKAGKTFKDLGPLKLACHAVSGLIERHGIDPDSIEAIAYGVVVPDPRRPNLAREIVFETGLPTRIEAQTISSYCITGLRTLTVIADAIASGRIEVGVAGGVDSLSHSDPETLQEPTTGLSMGEHTEITRGEWEIPRQRQDEIALASHRNAIAARDRLVEEILPLLGEERDTGPREGTSLEALAALKPVFDENGTITAGNASPLTDGATAVLLMSEQRARLEAREPLAFIRDIWSTARSIQRRGCSWHRRWWCRVSSAETRLRSHRSNSSRSMRPLPPKCWPTSRPGSEGGRPNLRHPSTGNALTSQAALSQ